MFLFLRLHSNAGGGLNALDNCLWQKSHVVGIWNVSSTKSWFLCRFFSDPREALSKSLPAKSELVDTVRSVEEPRRDELDRVIGSSSSSYII